jgi:beta-phosphoglucomutase-like phosphatase (HAD superfamily)
MEKLELQALETAQPTPFIKDFLKKTTVSNIDIYVVSMQSAKVVEKFLQKYELYGYFRGIITREKYPSKKAQVAYILKEKRICPCELLLVDDSKRNINTCQELGVTCFHFFRQQSPSKAIKMWDAILNLIKDEQIRITVK